MEATPPTTMPTKSVMDTPKPKLSGATNSMATAESEPAMPVIMALTAKALVFSEPISIPIASAAVGWSRVAIRARPMRLRMTLFTSRKQAPATMTVTTYIHWSGDSGMPAGASGLVRNRPCTPPVHSSIDLCLRICGTATASEKVVSAR